MLIHPLHTGGNHDLTSFHPPRKKNITSLLRTALSGNSLLQPGRLHFYNNAGRRVVLAI